MIHLLFLDVETTGLDPVRDDLLEIAAVHCTLEGGVLREHYRRTAVIEQRWAYLDLPPPMHPVVQAMHETSGLWTDLSDGHGQVATDVEGWILGAMKRAGVKRGEATIAGYSCHFDLAVLRERMPLLARFLSHRIVDVSTLRTLYWEPRGGPPEKVKAHRAMADVEASIEEFREYLPIFSPRSA